ncbi:MAG: hypothetical protein PHO44_08280 [Sphaerochaetaceae bacterium]|nr:hypothetical protein [Sphaerochaetaceae bacterium]
MTSIGKQPVTVNGAKCYQQFFGRSKPCEFCTCKEEEGHVFFNEVEIPETGRALSLVSELCSWNGRKMIIEFSTDITERRRSKKLTESIFANVPCGLCLYRS